MSNEQQQQQKLPVAVLYSFQGSCWAAAPRLALIEKGYGPDECTIKDVDLLHGANFSPEYLKINTAGTVPTLVVPQLASAVDSSVSTKYTALTTTVEILQFLDTSRSADSRGDAPARSLQPASIASKDRDDTLIKLVHDDVADPNFLLLSMRSQEEAKQKAQGIVGQFIQGRMDALNGYLKDTQERERGSGERLTKFYQEKLEAMEQLSAVLKGAPAEPFFAKSKQAWDNLNLVLKNVDALLPKEDRSGFISLADLHVGAWFARVLTCVGAKQLSDVAGSFEKLLAATGLEAADVAGVRKWWESMAQRQSFQTIYKDGLF